MNRRRKTARIAAFVVEIMECRRLLSSVAGGLNGKMAALPAAGDLAHTDYTRFVLGAVKSTKPDAGSGSPGGATPQQVRNAYGVNEITFGSVTGDGSGQTIAIIDAYDDPSFVSSAATNFANSDLHRFDAQFGLSDPPSFTKVSQTGTSTYPSANSGWDGEIALDVEWAHSMAPAAKIILVEAKSSSLTNLDTAVGWARKQSGVSAITMSWSGGEYSTETSDDKTYFSTPSGHAGISFFASTGDNGTPGGFPAASANVVAVGGTALTFADSSGTWANETVWNDTGLTPKPGATGGGISTYEAKPTYQNLVTTPSATKRSYPDVAMDADPYHGGVSVLDTSSGGIGSTAQWFVYGGTSLASPMWAGLDAIINQGRALEGLSSLDSGTQLLPRLYSLSGNDFHDVTSGNNALAGNASSFSAGVGYDAVTGRGTPKANLLVSDLAGVAVGGTVYVDTNRNGAFDSGETGKAGVTVYIDSNNNGVDDSGEPTTVTNGNGAYSFGDELGGVTYTIREVAPSGFTTTSAASISSAFSWGEAAGANFGLALPFATSYSGNTFTLRLDSSGTQEQIFTSVSATGTPAYSAAIGSFSSLSFSGSGAGDELNIDLSNGTPIPSGGVSFAGSGNNSQVIVTGSSGNDTIAASNTGLTFGSASATYSNVAMVSLNLGKGNDVVTDSLTTPMLAFALGSGSDTLNVNAGTVSFDQDVQGDGTSLSVNVASGAAVAFASSEHLAALNLTGGSATVSGSDNVLVTQSLSITGGGKLDLAGNAMVVNDASSGALGEVAALITSGRNGGSWDGAGIVTSMAAGSLATIGVSQASDALGVGSTQTGSWEGQTVSGSAVLVRYTYAGDANLDGVINGDDYFKIDNGFGGGATGYSNGDFNYDGRIDADDYFVIDSNYGHAQTAMAAAAQAAPVVLPQESGAAVSSVGVSAWDALSGGADGDAMV